MAGRNNTNNHLLRFGSTVLYYAIVLLLIVAIFIMYDKWHDRKKQYGQLVREAALQDQSYAIELQKSRDEPEGLLEENTETTVENHSEPETPTK